MDSRSLFLDELFLSLQGEASQLGRPQLFLRLAGCPLRCSYCDTPRSWKAQEDCAVHLRGGSELRPNPFAADALDALVDEVLASHGQRREGHGRSR